MSTLNFPIPIKIPTREGYAKVKKYLNISTDKCSVIYHRGKVTRTRDDTDVELDFRQESNFFYLTGVELAGYHLLIFLQSDEIYLVPPTVSSTEQLWKGTPLSNEELLKKYDADHILTEKRLTKLFSSSNFDTIYTLDTADLSFIPSQHRRNIDTTQLREALNEARLTKLPWEISLLRYSAHISSHAHISLMSHCGSSKGQLYEGELEARFRWVCAKNGLARQCYIPIIASGPRAAVLHYTDNDKLIPSSDHTLVLVDAGGEHKCYGSDVTRTFPIKGKFSDEAKTIYNIVLSAQNKALSLIKPGVYWGDLHNLVVRTLCHGLVKIGVLVGDVDELIESGAYRAFYFHGTGHSVGLDCHDVGGKDIGILREYFQRGRKGRSLDFNFTRALEENMVVTVEPGVYFNDVSIDVWTNNPAYRKYFDTDKIKKYRVIGGVRIEDTVLVTSNGIENFTIAPKEVLDIEALMSGSSAFQF